MKTVGIPGTDVPAVSGEEIDRRLAGLARPVPDRPSGAARLGAVLAGISTTPRQAALATTWLFSLVVMVVALIGRTSVSVESSLGAARVSCGLDSFVYGYPDPAVARACHHAEAARFGLFVPALLVVMAGLAYGLRLAIRSTGGRRSAPGTQVLVRLRQAPVQATLVALGTVAAVVGAFALRPAPLELVRSGVLISARCGVDSYFGSYPDPTVAAACSRAYSGRAHVLIGSLVVALVGLAALIQLAYTAASPGGRRRVAAGLVAGALAVGTLWGFWPVTVNITGGPAPVVAYCGMDTYVAGFPDAQVQSVCRSVYTPHAALGLTSGAAGLAVAGLLVATRRRSGDVGEVLEVDPT